MAHVLILDEQPSTRLAIRRAVEGLGHDATAVRSVEELRTKGDADALVLSLAALGPADGLAALLAQLPAPRVLVTADADLDPGPAREAGVFDCLSKPLDYSALGRSLQRCLAGSSPSGVPLPDLRDQPARGEILVGSAPMRAVIDQIEQVAPHDVTVLVTGESGTGKELVARALHDRSPRVTQPFVAVNCGAIPEELLESELFGHEKGSFTDAARTRKGRFELAGRGTLFLDEIGEMSTKLQVKLLRALQEREIQRVGGDRPIPVRARIVAATNRDLAAEVQAQRFREDLFHRLMVVAIAIPPLRDRIEDLHTLAPMFVRRFASEFGKELQTIQADAMETLLAHPWPGNVRELEHVLQRAVVFSRGPSLTRDDLPPLEIRDTGPSWLAPLRAHVEARMRAGMAPADVLAEITAQAEEVVEDARSGDNSPPG